MFHPQTTEIQSFKVECSSTKTIKFQQYDVIIYDVSADFRILFGMWISIVMSYSCAKFHHDITIILKELIVFFMFLVLCIFGQPTEVSVEKRHYL